MRCHEGGSKAKAGADRLVPTRRPSGTSVFLPTWHVLVGAVRKCPATFRYATLEWASLFTFTLNALSLEI